MYHIFISILKIHVVGTGAAIGSSLVAATGGGSGGAFINQSFEYPSSITIGNPTNGAGSFGYMSQP